MLVQGIKSRPQYPGLTADTYATNHVFIADGEGARAILDLFAGLDIPLKGRITIVYAETFPASARGTLHSAPRRVSVHCAAGAF